MAISYKMRALKRITFGTGQNVHFVEKGNYFDSEEGQMKKLVKLEAAELVSEEMEQENEGIDIGTLIEQLETFRTKKQLVEFGESLAVEGLDEEMKMEELKTAIINSVEERMDEA